MPAGFIDKLARTWPPETWRDTTVILAVSGGADSVSLLRGMSELSHGGPGRVLAAHFNHRLRVEEADSDEAFVHDLCRELDMVCVVGHADPSQLVRPQGMGIESAARQARYCFLREAAEQWGARYVVTAHTADDQAETILHRVLRGTGLRGLGGIPAVRPLTIGVTLIRPLLSVRRAEVYQYLQSLGQDFRTDSSNRDFRFARNRIRCDLIPRLAKGYNRDIVNALIRLGSLAGQAQSIIDRLVDQLVQRCVAKNDAQGVELNCRELSEANPMLAGEVFITIWRMRHWPLRDMGFQQWSELTALAQVPGLPRTRKTLPGRILAERDGERLRLKPNAS